MWNTFSGIFLNHISSKLVNGPFLKRSKINNHQKYYKFVWESKPYKPNWNYKKEELYCNHILTQEHQGEWRRILDLLESDKYICHIYVCYLKKYKHKIFLMYWQHYLRKKFLYILTRTNDNFYQQQHFNTIFPQYFVYFQHSWDFSFYPVVH